MGLGSDGVRPNRREMSSLAAVLTKHECEGTEGLGRTVNTMVRHASHFLYGAECWHSLLASRCELRLARIVGTFHAETIPSAIFGSFASQTSGQIALIVSVDETRFLYMFANWKVCCFSLGFTQP